MSNKKLPSGYSMLYVSSECDYGKAVDAVRKATNNAPLIRASSAGEFTEKPVEKGSGVDGYNGGEKEEGKEAL